ncbi:MgtE intracellular N domain [Helicobacter mustelae]|uniref:MotE family protein n=1 Tax=Helicobacter mustelae TaxID=217 RepID=UPI000E01E2A1|nr:flagellar protein FlbB [Helicobacter mustelae]STP12105.1 MgtE intracellular N domain [Helicobacter mustelae]
MKKILFFVFIAILNAEQNSQNATLQCNAIFESRKNEILLQLKELEEKKQSLEILKKASDELFAKREQKLKNLQKELALKLQEIKDKEKQLEQNQKDSQSTIKKLITKNEEVLKEIREATESKIAQTYAKMKDSKAAAILNDLATKQAAKILFYLKPSEIGKILAKMDPQKAAMLTEILKKGPPFEEESTPAAEHPTEEQKPRI